MIYEDDLVVTVEVEAEDEKKAREILKQFKRKLFAEYGPNPETRITAIKLR